MMNQEAKSDLCKEIEELEPIKNTDSKKEIENKLDKQVKVLKKIYNTDAFQNEMARLGFGQENLTEGADYPNTRKSYNFNLFNSMYRSSWIVRKIVDVFPSDMLKNWIKITSNIEPEKINKLERIIKKTKTKVKIKEGLKWARLYGGALGLILIDGDEDLEQPLDYDLIMPDTYKGLLIFDRWSGINPSVEMEEDINDIEFGLPKYYDIDIGLNNPYTIDNTSNIVKVHHSRVIRFEGRELPFWEKQYENYWGESEIEIALEEIKKRDNTSYNIASLIFLANIRVLKMNDLGQLLGAGSMQAQNNLWKVLDAQNHLMSNMGVYVMDKDDDFATEQYSFSGLNDIYESFMLDIAGACEMPVTKLFGRNPAGFNATGENDLKQYYETVEEKQETYLLPILEKLLPVICMSTFGAVPDDFDFEFNPIMSISNEDLAHLAQAMAEPVFDAFNSGLIDRQTALKELKQQSETVGLWSNITDDIIEQASQETMLTGYTDEEKSRLEGEIEPDNGQLGGEIDGENNDISYDDEVGDTDSEYYSEPDIDELNEEVTENGIENGENKNRIEEIKEILKELLKRG